MDVQRQCGEVGIIGERLDSSREPGDRGDGEGVDHGGCESGAGGHRTGKGDLEMKDR